MYILRIPHYAKRIYELGFSKSLSVFKNRIKMFNFERGLRKKAYSLQAAHSWNAFIHNNKITQSFEEFWNTQKTISLSFMGPLFRQSLDLKQADAFVNKTFDLLGSGPCTFTDIPWHDDIRLQRTDASADAHFQTSLYYKDIAIEPGTTDKLVKDIKLPWELSRCQHLLVLGQAYADTHDRKYVQAFQDHVTDWIDKNPYLLGPHWVCPMDVGIRAINLIVAFHYFKDSAELSHDFWKTFVCSLYDHMVYLEHNWEKYDSKTSNHYLSDLVGYLYLCFFFKTLPAVKEKKKWCYEEISKEFDKQVRDDGSDYEGSTRYHMLVTELFFHAYLIYLENGRAVPDKLYQKLRLMFSFIDWTKQCAIGDDDSGKVLFYGLTPSIIDAMKAPEKFQGTKHWPYFGLSVIKTPELHISLRHHVFNACQPSGHHHNDAGSITLTYKNIPIIVDPGSYVYTASAVWRNYFRSVGQHSTFFIQDQEPIPCDDKLFLLNIPQQSWAYERSQSSIIKTHHNLYAGHDLQAHRQLALENQLITITDWWQGSSLDTPTAWNFTFGPDISLEFIDESWHIIHADAVIARLKSYTLSFEKVQGWYSPSYGVKLPCYQLKATTILRIEQKIVITMDLV